MKLIAILIILVNCTSVVNGEIGFCYCHSCSENEGDCDSNEECQDGLACGSNNCPATLGFDSNVDCCINAISSPNYPNSYPSNAEETWLLTAPVGLIINLQFHSFHVRCHFTDQKFTDYQMNQNQIIF